jgi:hypothetical protein
MEKPEGKKPLGRPTRSWEDLRELRWGGMDWIDLDRDQLRALVNTVMNIRVP